MAADGRGGTTTYNNNVTNDDSPTHPYTHTPHYLNGMPAKPHRNMEARCTWTMD
eukprot:CAMPEP_0119197178 /NCGR_PEP_ID=MMETSP1316-20130426/13022_1 /TAXON_ID=41880 /ORGANISM="Pycnococcus provasolii, Strain RCC2336" /LENGTH=53 /DNA_ID=CAMNT_0007192955 /DNA_START=181 /DNA_END=339 /DNA_ORIENTATION=+